jgi:cytochrome c-type biogenesis protein CcmH
MLKGKIIIKLITTTLLLAVFLLSAFWALLPAAHAQDPDFDRINAIATKMNCPTCTGINLADCHTQTCAQWRDQIKDLVDQGLSDQEVLDYFVTQYGSQVLQEPPKSGFTLGLWVLPVIMILLGAIILFFTMRKMTAAPAPAQPAIPTQPASPPPSASDDPYLNRVEQDLKLN